MPEYQLRYLPQFYEDMKQHADYIANRLHNPQAAIDLIDAAEKAILERQRSAEAFEQFHSRKDRLYPEMQRDGSACIAALAAMHTESSLVLDNII